MSELGNNQEPHMSPPEGDKGKNQDPGLEGFDFAGPVIDLDPSEYSATRLEDRPENESSRERPDVAWLKEEINKRGVTLQGVGSDWGREPSASDLDGNFCIELLMSAGLVEIGKTEINYVRHRDYEAGRGQDAALILDIGKGDFQVTTSIKSEVGKRLSQENPEYVPVSRESASVVIDHHGPESFMGSGSASHKLYDMLVSMGLLDASVQGLRKAVESVDALDDKTYLREGFVYDAHSLAGLQKAVVAVDGGTKPLQFVNPRTKEFSARFLRLMNASQGRPESHISDQTLEYIGLWGTAERVEAKVQRARDEIERMKLAGEVIKQLPDGTYLSLDLGGRAFQNKEIFGEIELSDLLYEAGIRASIKTSEGDAKKGLPPSVFVNTFKDSTVLTNLASRFGGDVIRKRMWILNADGATLPTREELLSAFGATALVKVEQPDWELAEAPKSASDELDDIYSRYYPEQNFEVGMETEAKRGGWGGFWDRLLKPFRDKTNFAGLSGRYNDRINQARESDRNQLGGLSEPEQREYVERLRKRLEVQERLDTENMLRFKREEAEDMRSSADSVGESIREIQTQINDPDRAADRSQLLEELKEKRSAAAEIRTGAGLVDQAADVLHEELVEKAFRKELREDALWTYRELEDRRIVLGNILETYLLERLESDPELKKWVMELIAATELIKSNLNQFLRASEGAWEITENNSTTLWKLRKTMSKITIQAQAKIFEVLKEEGITSADYKLWD